MKFCYGVMTLLLLLGGTVPAVMAQNSQQDYLVKATGDTLRGRIKQVGKQHDGVRLYRPGQAPIEYTAAEASSYGSNFGPERVSRLLGPQGTQRFVVPLVEGPISLFSGENEQQDKRFYLQVPDSAYLIEVAPLTYQLTLVRQMGDCLEFAFGTTAFQKRYPYSQRGLSELVLAYNRCHTPQLPSRLVKHGTGIHASYGVKTGLNSARFNLTHPSSTGSLPRGRGATGYQAGLMLNVHGRTHFSAQLEAVYTFLRSEYGPFDLRSSNSGIPSNTVVARLRYHQVQLPLLLRYSAGYGSVRPFVNAGPVLAFNFKNTSATSFPIAKSIDQSIGVGNLNFGLAVGVGTWIKLPALPALTAELRYGYLENNGEKLDQNNYNSLGCTLLRLDFGIML